MQQAYRWKSNDLCNNAYENCKEPIDNVITSIFNREIRRQQFHQLDNNLIMLIAEKFAANGEIISIESLLSDLDLWYGVNKHDILSKLLINPLFTNQGYQLHLKYDFLESYFRYIYILNSILNKSKVFEAFSSLDKLNTINSIEFIQVSKYFKYNKNKIYIIKEFLIDLISEIRKSQEYKKREYLKKSISAILKLLSEVEQWTTSIASGKIKQIFANKNNTYNSISNLYIYGDFKKIDLSDLNVHTCHFKFFKNFCNSNVNNSKFTECIFEECYSGGYFDQSFSTAFFENDCKIGDLEELISQAKQKSDSVEKNIDNELTNFIGSFFQNGSPFDPKTEWINFSNKISALSKKNFSKLIPKYIEKKSEKSKGTHYEISEAFLESAFNYYENRKKDLMFKEFIEYIKNNK